MRLFGHDVFFLLDNAYRVLQGQVPHRDFSSAWGPVIYLVEAAGLKMSGLAPTGLGYASAMCGALLSIWTYAIARRQLTPGVALTAAIVALVIVLAPYPIGYHPEQFSYAMLYNRLGYALLAIIMIESLTESTTVDSRAASVSSGVSTGCALAVLGFLKISYGIAAVPFIAMSALYGGANRKRLSGVLLGAVGVSVLMLLYLRFDVSDMLNDLLSAASGRSKRWSANDMFYLGFREPSQTFPVLLLATALVWTRWADVGLTAVLRVRPVLVALMTLTVGGLLVSSNCQPSTPVLPAFIALLFCSEASRSRGRSSAEIENVGIPIALMALLACGPVVPLLGQSAEAISIAAIQKWRPHHDFTPIKCARADALVFAKTSYRTDISGVDYVRALNEGLELLRKHSGTSDGVLTIDMVNPFNYLLDRPSPTGGIAAAAFNYTFDEYRHPPAERLFGNARYVLVRKYHNLTDDFYINGYRQLYSNALLARFAMVDERAHWKLYCRK